MKKLFTNDKFFLATTLIAFIGGLFFVAVESILWPHSMAAYLFHAISVVCLLVVYISYKNHSKNVMKGMIGALLMAEIAFAITYISILWTTQYAVDRLFLFIYLALMIILFVNHFIINSDHHSSPMNIKVNQFITVLLVVCYIVWLLFWLPNTLNMLEIVSVIAYVIAFPCLAASVVCVESRLDAYRLDREAAGWTEEAGYPEGYVHEYEKK